MNTLLLDTQRWDVCLDSFGNIALATDPYSAAQDVASAVRTFIGECWYNTSIGVPYYQQILGKFPPLSLVKSLIKSAAMTVPGVTNVVVYITNLENRNLTGQIQFTDTNVSPSTIVVVGFGPGVFMVGGQEGGVTVPAASVGGSSGIG